MDVGSARYRGKGHELVLCTRNRPRSLERCLERVLAAAETPSHVVVIDGGDDGQSLDVVKRISSRSPFTRISHVSATPGLTHQRNVGLSVATADIVHFLDDDAFVSDDYFSRILDVFETGPDVVGAGGVQAAMPPTKRRRLHRVFGLAGSPGSVTRAFVNTHVSPAEAGLLEVDWLAGCCMSFRRKAAQSVGFDEALSGYALGEDVDFSLRISRLGRLIIDPRAVVDHEHAAVGRPARRRIARDDVLHRRYFLDKMPQHGSRPAFWWSLVGLLVLLPLKCLRQPLNPDPRARLAGTIDAMRVLLAAPRRTG